MIKYVCDYELTRGTEDASGFDLRCGRVMPREIAPGERWLVPTSLRLQMPRGVGGFVCSRSGLSLHHGVVVLNAPGVIDADYRGEIGVTLINLGQKPFMIAAGDRIAQLLFMPVIFPEQAVWPAANVEGALFRVWSESELTYTSRGSSGHGSTGVS